MKATELKAGQELRIHDGRKFKIDRLTDKSIYVEGTRYSFNTMQKYLNLGAFQLVK